MSKTAITIEIDNSQLARYTDERLALAWHVAQANPVPHGDCHAGELAERIGREITRRWLRQVEPELWNHQGRDYYWQQLAKIATYQPAGPSGTPEFHEGTWTPRTPATPTGEPGNGAGR